MGLLPVFIAFAVGIVLHDHAFRIPGYAYALALTPLALSFVWVRDRKVWILLASFLAFLGAGLLSYRTDGCSARILSRRHSRKISLSGWVDRPVSISPGMEKMVLEVDRLDGKVVGMDGCLLHLTLITGSDIPATGTFLPVRGDYVTVSVIPRRPRNYKNPGSFDYRQALGRSGIFLVAYGSGSGFLTGKHPKEHTGPGTRVLRAADASRRRIRRTIDEHVQDEGARGVITALVIGDQGRISREVRRMFASTGIIHILIVAGLHLGIITHLAYLLFKLLLSRSRYLCLHANIPKLSLSLSLIPMIAYLLISGAHPPVIRSSIMLTVYGLIFLADRHQSRWIGILVAAFLILAMEPGALYSISFQLSFVSVGSIIAFMPAMTRLIERMTSIPGLQRAALLPRAVRAVLGMLLVSLFITIGLAGLLAFYFNTVPLLGILLNVVVIPVFGYGVLPLSLLSSVAGISLPPALQGIPRELFALTSWLIQGSIGVIGRISRIPLASIRVPTPSIPELVLYYAIVLVVINVKRIGPRLAAVLVTLLATALFAAVGYHVYTTHSGKDLSITFLDIGHGDSALVEFPHGRTMLIDGGGSLTGSYDTGESVVARYLWSLGITSIDDVVASHPQVDHIGGLGFVIRHLHAREVYRSDCGPDTAIYRDFMDAIRISGVAVHTITTAALSRRISGVDVTLFSVPHEACNPGSNRDANNYPVLTRIAYGRVSFLFTGDIEKKAEQLLVDAYGGHGVLRASILKVAHHGSKTSSTGRFIDTVRPAIAVISAGENNRFHLPAKVVLRRFFRRRVCVLRTDRSGAIRITTDGTRLRIRRYVEDGGW